MTSTSRAGDEAPHILYTKVSPTARRIFDHQCKKTFATKSAITGCEQSQQIASYSITSSARASSVGGTSIPRAAAVLRLTINA
jgi:hypothetical protein